MLELLKNLISPEWIMLHGGIYIVLLIIFAETGLFIGFFLPGDTLLFITGVILTNSSAPFDSDLMNISYWLTLIIIAGIAGNFVGYWFGRKSGTLLYERKDTWFFKQKHLRKASAFYENKGGGAIVMARFLPVIRTFAPIIAGIVKMDARKFSIYNVIGSVAWVVSLVLAGYFLGDIKWVKEHLELIIIGIVIATTLPVILKFVFTRDKQVALERSGDPNN
jgi:membrane-associated protein